jgi:hypothetical protein
MHVPDDVSTTSTVPPCSSTNPLTMANPSPVPGTLWSSALGQPSERLEHALALLDRHARPFVGDIDEPLVVLDGAGDGDLAAVRSELDGVADEILDDLAKAQIVGLECRTVAEVEPHRDRPWRHRRCEVGDHLPQDGGDVERHPDQRDQPGVEPAHHQQIIDQPRQPISVAVDETQVCPEHIARGLADVEEMVDGTHDRRQRRAELVGDGGDEPQPCLGELIEQGRPFLGELAGVLLVSEQLAQSLLVTDAVGHVPDRPHPPRDLVVLHDRDGLHLEHPVVGQVDRTGLGRLGTPCAPGELLVDAADVDGAAGDPPQERSDVEVPEVAAGILADQRAEPGVVVGDPSLGVLDRGRRQRLDGSRQARHRRGELDPAEFVGGDVPGEGDESADLLDVAHIGQQRLEPAPGPSTVEHAVAVRRADALAVCDLQSDHRLDAGLVVGVDERASIAGEPAVVAEPHQSCPGSIDRALPAGVVEHRDDLRRPFEDLLQHLERRHGVRTITGSVPIVDHAEIPLVAIDGEPSASTRGRRWCRRHGASASRTSHRAVGVAGVANASEPGLVRTTQRGRHDEVGQPLPESHRRGECRAARSRPRSTIARSRRRRSR